jgi:hypothetical protein
MTMALPGINQPVGISGEIRWSDGSGRVGIQFMQVSPDVTELLRSWLFDRLQESLSATVVAKEY